MRQGQSSAHCPQAQGWAPALTPSGICLQHARYVWNKTEMLAAAADPDVQYLMGNKCPTSWDLAATAMHAGTQAVPNMSPSRAL